MDENKEGLVPVVPQLPMQQFAQSQTKSLGQLIKEASDSGRTVCIVADAGHSNMAQMLATHNLMEKDILIVDLNTLRAEDRKRVASASAQTEPTIIIPPLQEKAYELTALPKFIDPIIEPRKGEWYEGHKKNKKKKGWR